MSLRQWLDNGWMSPHETSREEIADLLAVARRDLTDCEAGGLSDDWRFAIAYNAALQLATAALSAAGYRTARGQSHHLRVIQSLQFTLRPQRSLIDRFEGFRVKRNVGTYDRAGAVSGTEAAEMIALARELRDAVDRWLLAEHPELISTE